MNPHDIEPTERPIIDKMLEQIKATPFPADSPPRATSLRLPSLARIAPTKWITGAGVAAAGLIVALILALGASSGPSPAFAATVNPNRTVTITLRQISALDLLNARLASLGTRIRIVPVIKGCVAPVHTVSNGHVLPGRARTLRAISQGSGATVSMTIGVNTIPGRTFVIALTRSGLQAFGVVVGAAPRCAGSSSPRSGRPFLIPAGPRG